MTHTAEKDTADCRAEGAALVVCERLTKDLPEIPCPCVTSPEETVK